MNGIHAVAVALGQDWRAIEAGAHAYAAVGGNYRPLCTWRRTPEGLVGEAELPLAVGTVGESTSVPRGVRVAMKLVGTESAHEFAVILTAAGLASNLAALRALAGERFQRGQKKPHERKAELLLNHADVAVKSVSGIASVEANAQLVSLARCSSLIQSELEQTESLGFHAYALIGSDARHREICHSLNALKLDETVEKFAQVSSQISSRKVSLWKWCRYLNERIMFSCVVPEYAKELNDTKTISHIFLTLLDDIVDEMKKPTMFREARKIITERADAKFGDVNEAERHFLEVARDMWCHVYERVRRFPRYAEFAAIFFYDYSQLINSFEYSLLANTMSQFINYQEYVSYMGHNMHVLLNSVMDLMCSPSFGVGELGVLRGVVMDVQTMCRICNWITTWERELYSMDLTSGVVALALDRRVISPDDLRDSSQMPTVVDQIKNSDVVERLILEWEKRRHAVASQRNKVKSVDINAYLEAADEFLTYSFAFRGLH
jgi:hypothetical protein